MQHSINAEITSLVGYLFFLIKWFWSHILVKLLRLYVMSLSFILMCTQEISLNEVQLQQILILWDYLCGSQLRKKYVFMSMLSLLLFFDEKHDNICWHKKTWNNIHTKCTKTIILHTPACRRQDFLHCHGCWLSVQATFLLWYHFCVAGMWFKEKSRKFWNSSIISIFF